MIVRIIHRLCIWFVLAAAIWLFGFGWFLTKVPTTQNSNIEPQEVIVALTGGAGRIDYALQLLVEQKGKLLFISGVNRDVRIPDVLAQANPALRKKIKSHHVSQIVLGDAAVNTIGNAEEVKSWLEKEGYTKLILVTSSYHMPRSMEEFKHVLPVLTIIPAPVLSSTKTPLQTLVDKETRELLLSEYHKLLAAKLRHLLLEKLPA